MHWFDSLTANPTILLIPLIAGAVGYGTNAVAVLMMFRPREFVGIRPWFGWQGIIPRFTPKAAEYASELVASHLLDLRRVFDGFDPKAFLEQSGLLDEWLDQGLSEQVERVAPALGQSLDDAAWAQLQALVRSEIEAIVAEALEDIAANIEQILDLRYIVKDTLNQRRYLLAEIFLRVGGPELNFIRNSGFYFGFLFGIPQMIVWAIWPSWWLLPAAGFVVGYVTNWLAINLIFDPKEPVRVGPFVVQGLLHRRQREMAEGIAAEVAAIVLDPDVLVHYMTTGPRGELLMQLVRKHLDAAIERFRNHPLAAGVLAQTNLESIRAQALAEIDVRLRQPGGFLERFIRDTVDVHREIVDNMVAMEPEAFEGLLRPVFQQEEWILIAIGAVLGLLVGWAQVAWLFQEMLI